MDKNDDRRIIVINQSGKLGSVNPMKTKFKSITRAAYHLFGGTVLLLAASTQAQNLFVADFSSGNIYEYTPGGAKSTFASGLSSPEGLAFNRAGDLFVSEGYTSIIKITPSGAQSTFASGLNNPVGLAFNNAGDLFVANQGAKDIIEITPDGGQSVFASGLNSPWGPAFNSAGNLFESDGISGNIYEFTPDGVRSTFALGLAQPTGLAFSGETLPVPEPSAYGLLAIGATALFVRRRRTR